MKNLIASAAAMICLVSPALAEGWVQNPRCASCLDYVEKDGTVHWQTITSAHNSDPEVAEGHAMNQGNHRCREIATMEENARLAGNETLRRMEANNYNLDCR